MRRVSPDEVFETVRAVLRERRALTQ